MISCADRQLHKNCDERRAKPNECEAGFGDVRQRSRCLGDPLPVNNLDRELLHHYPHHGRIEADRMAAVTDVCEICRLERREPRSRVCAKILCQRFLEAIDEMRAGGPPSWRLERR